MKKSIFKLSKKYSILTSALLAFSFMFSACAPKKVEVSTDSLALIVPENATFYAIFENYDEYMALFAKEKGYAEAMEALKSNKKINDVLLKIYAPILELNEELTSIFIDKENFIASYEELVLNSITDGILFSTSKLDCAAEEFKLPLTILLRIQNEKILEKIKESFAKSESLVLETVGDKEIYKSKVKDSDFFVCIADGYLAFAFLKEDILSVFDSLKNPPAKSILDNAKFQKISKDFNANVFAAFMDFNALENINVENELGKNTLDNIESLGFFASYNTVYEFDMSFRAILKDESLVYNVLSELALSKLDSVKRALANSELVVSYAAPQLTKSLTELLMKLEGGEEILDSMKTDPVTSLFTDNLQQIDISIVDIANIAKVMEGKTPKVLANAYFKDANKVMTNENFIQTFASMMFSAEKIDGLDCLVSMFGITIAKISDTQISVIYTKDLSNALKTASGNGDSLVSNEFAKKMLDKVSDKNSFITAYMDYLPFIAMQRDITLKQLEFLEENEKGKEIAEYMNILFELTEAAYKKCGVSSNVKCKDNMFSWNFFAVVDLDFEALAKKAKEIK